MVHPRKNKYETGEGAQFWTRAKAMRKLQLSLKDFRRLCILKGIYPREPRSRKRAQRGEGGIQTLYHKKDIQFLLHEPIIWKFRDAKVHGRRIGRAKAMREFGVVRKLLKEYPEIKLDHIIKERYPTFIDALRDLDDALTLCFLFGNFPMLHRLPRDQSCMSRRLTLEFMHVVMATQALRKVFISIKGYYFQAEIKGVTITWIVPHHFSFEPQSKEEVDFKIMSTFVQFYIVMLGFVNFRLYSEYNLVYPPVFSNIRDEDSSLIDRDAIKNERVAALNIPLKSVANAVSEEDVEIDRFNLTNDPGAVAEIEKEATAIERLKTLFKGLKVFLNREVPREPLTFVLRCFGAEVSWDKNLFVGAVYPESDETITHHIIDRPSLEKQYISRYYVQPQWVFDSVNARELVPVEKYFIGAVLPPHLSPFVDSNKVRYEPPEETGIPLEIPSKLIKEKNIEDESESEDQNSSEDEDEEQQPIQDDDENSESDASVGSVDSDESDKKRSQMRKIMKTKMAVKKGEVEKEDPDNKRKEDYQEYKLREKMVEKKHRALYKSMMKGRRSRNYDVKILKKKRIILEQKKRNVAK